MRIAEVQLDHAFAESLGAVPGFQQWLLTEGRFARHAESATLLREEQHNARNAMHWWKHWWCRLPDGTESETDIFLVFQSGDLRFALHIENKPSDGQLKLDQATRYRRRAAFKANDPKWLNYSDFETILLAPQAFLDLHVECLSQFDRAISYEGLAAFVPLFSQALDGR